MHVSHPVLAPGVVEFRGYQANLARLAGKHDTLVVLPTGMGKTVVALLAIADALQAGARRILFMAPTRPLVEQHAESLRKSLAEPWPERVHALTGTQSPAKRAAAYASPDGCIVVATPQVVQNDIVGNRLDLSQLDFVVFDEAHRAAGDYPYTFIGQQLRKTKARRLGLTASPGHEARKIEEVRDHLGLSQVEIRSPADPDVAPFVRDIGMEWETLPLPPVMARVSAKLQEALQERVRALKAIGLLQGTGNRPTRKDLLRLGGDLQARLSRTPQPEQALFFALSLQAQAMKVLHAIEQVETQGAAAFVEYIEGLREEAAGAKASKATRSLAEDARIQEAYHIARFDDSENPKLGRTGTLVQSQLEADAQARVIVFTHYRSTCELVCNHLSKLPGVRPVVFVGQSNRRNQQGLSQKEQQAVLQRFRDGAHNVLVATSVAEEGLDIPDTDLVVFFEPIPSEIRSIQRRGRTGRSRAGRVVVLMTKGTQDEAAHWASRRKEKEMVRELQVLRAMLAARQGGFASSRLPLEAADLVDSGTPPGKQNPAQGTLAAPEPSAEPARQATAAPRASSITPSAATPSVTSGRPPASSPSATAPSPSSPSATAPSSSSSAATAPSAASPSATAPATSSASAQPRQNPAGPVRPTPSPASPGGPSAPAAAAATPQALRPASQARLPQPSLGAGPRIVFDLREQQGGVVRHLHDLGANLEGRQLEVGDFILSDRVAVERKTCADFVDSLVDGRLFEQLRTLRTYPRPFLVLEGESLHGHRNVSVEALMGALAAVTVDHGIPVLQVRDSLETARFLHAVARREQSLEQRKMAVRPAKPPMTDEEHQVYLLAGLPGVSDVLARRLLDRFGSVSAALAASVQELADVEGVGPQKASGIRRILDLAWD